jgi:hypothetical protein
MNPKIKVGSVVQINPETHKGFFPGCFMLVTEVKSWGAQGFIAMPRSREEPPGEAYYRAKWEEMEYVGEAKFVPGPGDEG